MTKFKVVEIKRKEKIEEGFWDAVESPITTAKSAIKGSKIGQKPGVQQAGRIAAKAGGILYRFAKAVGVKTQAFDTLGNIIGGGKSGKNAPSAQKFKEGLKKWIPILATAAGVPENDNEDFLTDIGWFNLSAQGNKFANNDPLAGYELGGVQKKILDFKQRMSALARTDLFTNPLFFTAMKAKKNELADDRAGGGISGAADNETFLKNIGYNPTLLSYMSTSGFADTVGLVGYNPSGGTPTTILDFKQHWHSLAKGGMLN